MATNEVNITARPIRYSIDSFKITYEKKVPFEELDYGIYKNSNLVVFTTSERRLPCWIDIMKRRYTDGLKDSDRITTRYEEIDNTTDTTKCDKVIISLISKDTKVIIMKFSTTINTGRIKIEGPYIKEWGSMEFEKLLTLINHYDEPNNINPSEGINNFIDAIFNETVETIYKGNKESNETINIKTNLSALEAEFVEFSQTTKKTIQDLTEALAKKDDEMNKHIED